MEFIVLRVGNEQASEAMAWGPPFRLLHANSVEEGVRLLSADPPAMALVETDASWSASGATVCAEIRRRIPGLSVIQIVTPSSEQGQRPIKPPVPNQIVQTAGQVLLGQTARHIAHDLTNSVSFVLCNLRTLCGYHDDLLDSLTKPIPDELKPVVDDLTPLVEESIEGVTRIQLLVRELRDFTKTEEKERESVDVHEPLEGALCFTAPEISRQVRLIRNYRASARALGWSTRLRQCFAHLLLSYARTMITGSDKVELVVETFSDANWIEIGLFAPGGLNLEIVQSVWQPYFTNHSIVNEPGLLLAAADHIVQLHEGILALESRPAESWRMNIKLPVDADSC